MTEKEINEEAPKVLQALGDRAYRFALPVLEFSQLLNRYLFLNQEMHKLRTEKAEAEKKTDERVG